MNCAFPQATKFTVKGNTFIQSFPCGRCMPCRVNKRREWTGRIILEHLCHPASTFITLTYNDEHLPKDGNLDFNDLTLFLKRLRKAIGQFRYFAVGEYGDRLGRPHFHAIIFGQANTWAFNEHLVKAWSEPYSKGHKPLGFVQASEFTKRRAAYVARYTTKKLSVDYRTDGREVVEQARMSRRPGIGHLAVDKLAASFRKYGFVPEDNNAGLAEVLLATPGLFRYDGKLYPLSRGIRQRLIALDPTNKNTSLANSILMHIKSTQEARSGKTEEKRKQAIAQHYKERRRFKKQDIH